MGLLKEIDERRAYRALKTQAVPNDALKNIIAAGTYAPSCYNNQPWRVVASTGASLGALKASLSEGNVWANRAPAILAVAVKESDDCRLEDGRGELEGEDASLLKDWQLERDKGSRQRKPVGETAFRDSWGQGWS